ncbi:hypothetical protein ACFL1P_01440 [Patescibacteria group bacterium]
MKKQKTKISKVENNTVSPILRRYKNDFVDACKVISGQKQQSTITPKDFHYPIQFTKSIFEKLIAKHPDKANANFNEALGFISTLHYPDKLKKIPKKQKIIFYRKLTGKHTGKLNIVIIKSIENNQKSYVNTSYLIGRKQRVIKVLSEGAAIPSSPKGVGTAISDLKSTKRIITRVNKQK